MWLRLKDLHFLARVGSLFASHRVPHVALCSRLYSKKGLVEFHTQEISSCKTGRISLELPLARPCTHSSQLVMLSRLCVLLLCAELRVSPHRCVFDEVQPRVRVVRAARPSLVPKLGEVAPMRIGTWLSGEGERLSQLEEGQVRATVERAVRTVSSLLSVERASSPLLLSRDVNKYCKFLWKNSSGVNYNRCGQGNKNYRYEMCLDVKIPDDHLAGCKVYPQSNSTRGVVLRHPGGGVADVDFLLYLHVQMSDKCRAQPRLLAYAAHCRTDASGRPLAGVVVICRERLTSVSVQTVVHELFHALGFSRDLFATWVDCSVEREISACSPWGKVTHADGTGQMRLYTPSVISALQRHLAAVDPELGGPLENSDAAPGGVSSHWEARLLQGSVMLAAPGPSGAARIDPLTLAAFQDTGWYVVNTSRAQNLVWGKGEGALFGSKLTCHDNSSSFFCAGSGLGCHHLHLHKGECQTDAHLDGCRIYKALENRSECWKKENERKSGDERHGGEVFGSGSRCFFSNLTTLNHSQLIVTGRCYRHRCTGPNRYQVQVLGCDWLDCPAGGSIQIRGYQGSVFCPDKRLCLDSHDSPPSEAEDVFPTGQPNETLLQEDTRSAYKPAADPLVTTVFCVLAALGLLILGLTSTRCTSCKVRIHAASGMLNC